MAWGRGFFRIWIVLSALWVAVAVYFQEPKTFKFWRAVYELQFEGKPVFQLNTANKEQAEIAAELTAAMQARRPDIDRVQLEKDRDQILAVLQSTHQNAMAEAKTWLLTVLPPLALLGFGLCILWIARGFRRPAPAREHPDLPKVL